MRKKLLSIILSLAMVLTMIPAMGSVAYAVLGNLSNVQISADGVITWDAYSGVDGFKIKVPSMYHSWSVNDPAATSFDLNKGMRDSGFPSGDYTVEVYGITSDEVELTNKVSLNYSYVGKTPLNQATNLRWDGAIARWDAPADGTSSMGYVIYIKSGGTVLDYRQNITDTYYDCSKVITDPSREYYFYVYAQDYTGEHISSKSADSATTYGIPFAYEDIPNAAMSSEGVITFDALEGANRYCIHCGSSAWDVIAGESIDVVKILRNSGFSSGDYTIELYAEDKDGYRISNIKTFTLTDFFAESLARPSGLVWDGCTARWDAIEHADQYFVSLYADGVYKAQALTTQNFYDFSHHMIDDRKSYQFHVYAADTTHNYASSEIVNSPELKLDPLAAPANPVWDGSMAKWDAVEHADSYYVRLYIDGVYKAQALTENNYYSFSAYTDDPSKTYSFDVSAADSGRGYAQSEYAKSADLNLQVDINTLDWLPDVGYNYTYTGKAITPEFHLFMGDIPSGFIRHTAWESSYSNNVKVGVATLTITGVGKYKGTKVLKFSILPATPSAKSIKLSATKYTYNGSVKSPTLVVKDDNGNTLVKGTDYTVSVPSGRKKVGKYSYKVTFKGNYSGTRSVSFKINPATPSIKSITPGIKEMTVKMTTKPSSKGASAYQIYYKQKGASTWKKTTTTSASKTIKSLKKGKCYYVKVRAYKKVNGTTYYGAWSKDKLSKKIKK